MKKILYIAIPVLALLVLTLIACKPQESPVVVQSVLLDTTDTIRSLPEAQTIKESYGFQNELWRTTAYFRVRTIDQIVVSDVREFQVHPMNAIVSNQLDRIGEINTFFMHIDQSINSLASELETRSNSSVYATIADELIWLSEHEGTTKRLLIFSNLLDNQPGFLSFYDANTLAMLDTHPENILKKFEEHTALPDLSDIDIEIIHDPGSNYAQAKVFQDIAAVYEELFKQHGVKSFTIKLHH